MRRLLALLAFFLIPAMTPRAAPISVTFKLIELEKPDRPLAGVPVRIVLGKVADWQGPNAGRRFVTDSKGEAHFTAGGIVDRRWRTVPLGTTGLSVPKRADHIMIALELEQLVPTASGKYKHYQWLHTLDIDCYTSSDCSTSDIVAVYTRDKKGRFTVKGEPGPAGYGHPGLKMPELGGMILSDPGYKVSDFFLAPADSSRKRWNLRLTLERRPAPVMR